MLPPGYVEWRIEMTPSAIVATSLASFLGLCLLCVVGYKVLTRCVDNSLRKHMSNSFNHALRTV